MPFTFKKYYHESNVFFLKYKLKMRKSCRLQIVTNYNHNLGRMILHKVGRIKVGNYSLNKLI